MAAAPPQVASDLIPIVPLARSDVVGRPSRDNGYECLTYDLHYVMEAGKEVRYTDKPLVGKDDITLTVPLAAYGDSSVPNLLKQLAPYHRLSVFIAPLQEPLVSITLHRSVGYVPAWELIAGITQAAVARNVPFIAMRDLIAEFGDDAPELKSLEPPFDFTPAAASGQTPDALLGQFLADTDAKEVVLAWKLAPIEKDDTHGRGTETHIQVWQLYCKKPAKCPEPVSEPAPPAPSPAAPSTVVIFNNLKKRRQGDK